MKDYENTTEVPWYSYMENIKSVSFDNVKKLGNNCFNGATNLTEIVIPESVEVIGNNSFKDCKSLENIVYKGLNNLCNNNTNAFENVNSSIAIVSLSFEGNEFCGLETSKTKCGKDCQWKYNEERNELIISGTGEMNDFPTDMNPWFEIKDNIISVNISDGITSIGSNAFKDCINLKIITIGTTVTTIRNDFVNGCINLKQIKFDEESNFKYENGMILSKNDTELILYLQKNNETDFIFLPDELETIHPYAFSGNEDLEMIVIPMNVKTIGDYAFSGCSKLKYVYYLGTEKSPSANDNIFEGLSGIKLKVKNGYSFTIGSLTSTSLDKVNCSTELDYFIDEETGLMVFYGNGECESSGEYPWYSTGSKIKHVIFEEGVTKIISGTFNNRYSYFPNIKTIRIGNSVTIIDKYSAFSSCSTLTMVTIGKNMVTIGQGAFDGCSSLTTLIIKSINQISISFGVFWNCFKLSTIYFYSSFYPDYQPDCCCCKGTGDTGGPFYCNTSDDITVYVPKNYPSATTFCAKNVTFSRTL